MRRERELEGDSTVDDDGDEKKGVETRHAFIFFALTCRKFHKSFFEQNGGGLIPYKLGKQTGSRTGAGRQNGWDIARETASMYGATVASKDGYEKRRCRRMYL